MYIEFPHSVMCTSAVNTVGGKVHMIDKIGSLLHELLKKDENQIISYII